MKKFTLLSLLLLVCGVVTMEAQVAPRISDDMRTYTYHMKSMNNKYPQLESNTSGAVGYDRTTKVEFKLEDSGSGDGTYHIIPVNHSSLNGPIGCDGTTDGSVIYFTAVGSPKAYDDWVLHKAPNGYYHLKLKANTDVAFTPYGSQTFKLFNYTATPTNSAYQWIFEAVNTTATNIAPTLNKVETILANGGKTGYLTTENSLYTDLEAKYSSYMTSNADTDWTELAEAYDTYVASTDDVVMPSDDKFYHIDWIYWWPKSIYNDGDMKWGTFSEAKNTFYWKIVDGKLMNGNGQYVKWDGQTSEGDHFTMTNYASEASTVTKVALAADNQFSIYFTEGANRSEHFHANHHSSGTGSGSDVIAYDGGKNSPSVWRFNEISGYDGYKVSVTGLEDLTHGGVSRTSTSETAINGGYLFTSGDAFAEGDLAAMGVEGYVSTVTVNADKTITVAYRIDDATFSTLLRGHIDNEAKPVLDKRGVGYPMTTSEAYTTFAGVVAEAEAAITAYQENETAFEGTEIETLMAAIDTYKETTEGLQMPEDGKVYVFTNKHSNMADAYLNYNTTSDMMEYVERDTDTDLPSSAYFICRDLGNGKYVFVNSMGKYLILKGNNDYTNPASNNKKGYVNVYNTDGYCDVCVAKESLFGTVKLSFKRSGSQYSALIRTKSGSNSTFNQNGDSDINSTTSLNNATHSTVFTVEEVTDYTYNKAELKASGDKAYSTLYLPYATTIPGDVQAYRAATLANNTLTMAEVTGTIPAETGVVLVGNATAAHTFLPALEAGEEVTSLLTGIVNADEAISNPDSKVICALNGANTIGFYKFTGTVRPGKAYLLADATMQAKGFTMNFGGETTGIEGIVTENTDKVVYDLSGRRIQNPTKGLYIIGGKKVYIK